jgi:hypothetical protein
MHDQEQTVQTVVPISITDAAQVYGGMMKLPPDDLVVTEPVSDETFWD